jgi:hypothetical protein
VIPGVADIDQRTIRAGCDPGGAETRIALDLEIDTAVFATPNADESPEFVEAFDSPIPHIDDIGCTSVRGDRDPTRSIELSSTRSRSGAIGEVVRASVREDAVRQFGIETDGQSFWWCGDRQLSQDHVVDAIRPLIGDDDVTQDRTDLWRGVDRWDAVESGIGPRCISVFSHTRVVGCNHHLCTTCWGLTIGDDTGVGEVAEIPTEGPLHLAIDRDRQTVTTGWVSRRKLGNRDIT